MSDELVAKFERRIEFLIHRDGQHTLIPSSELTVGDLFMSMGVNCFFNKMFGGTTVWTLTEAYDSTGTVYLKRTCNGDVREFEFNLERILHHTPALQALMPLEDLADV